MWKCQLNGIEMRYLLGCRFSFSLRREGRSNSSATHGRNVERRTSWLNTMLCLCIEEEATTLPSTINLGNSSLSGLSSLICCCSGKISSTSRVQSSERLEMNVATSTLMGKTSDCAVNLKSDISHRDYSTIRIEYIYST